MAKKEYHTDETEGATPFSLTPSAFMTMGRQHIQECVRAHAQLVDKFQEVNRSWLQCLQSEADLSAEFTPKMITARSIPDAATVLLEWTNRHVEMAALASWETNVIAQHESRRWKYEGDLLFEAPPGAHGRRISTALA
jgi:hypothetical protein